MKNQLLLCAWLLLPGTGEATDVPPAPTPKGKPNVLFIVIDDLNDYLSLLAKHPGLQTPHLDKFARSALTFTRAYCAAPICNPSRTALLSGIAPHRSGVYENGDRLTAAQPVVDAVLLPEQFKRAGYRTMWNGKLFHTEPGPERRQRMWDDSEGGKGNYGPQPKRAAIPASIQHPPMFNYEAWEGPDTDFPDYRNAQINVRRLEQKYEQPFFLVYGIYRPHNPWTAPKRFFDQHPLPRVTLPHVPTNDLADVPAVGREYARTPVDFAALQAGDYWRPVVQSYLASIAFMDHCLGLVLDALERGPNRENTIVCIVADHGFHLGEKEHFAKFALWEQTTHVIALWRVPGITPANSRCAATISLLDLYPTFNELCGLPAVPQQLDGQSLVPLLQQPQAPWGRPVITTYRQNDHAVRDARWRYIRYHDGSEELYDHDSDPQEWTNVANRPEHAAVKARLAQWLPRENVPPVNRRAARSDDD